MVLVLVDSAIYHIEAMKLDFISLQHMKLEFSNLFHQQNAHLH
jgi:hypothetical protein